jgi:uracil-DNA glycosylase
MQQKLNSAQIKQQKLDDLYSPYIKCLQCPLGFLGRKNVVFGEGNPDSPIMFIGEGPGEQEDLQGRPFVGKSGKLLTRTLEGFGVMRSDVFITNIVKCRPPQNRKPLPLESKTCKNLLLITQIEIINPQIICTLGSASLEGLLEISVSITKTRGNILPFGDRFILPTFHPAYILRNQKQLPTFIHDIKNALSLSTRLQGE